MSETNPIPTPESQESTDSSDGPTKIPVVETDSHGYWRANLKLIAVLLVIWAVVSYGCGILFIEPLNEMKLGELPLGYWFANQGAIYTFVIEIWVYAFLMEKIDKKYGVNE
ncbi:MAG: DUF4212 domain-containing protein [Planctomycetota bacterium]|jgi:putative solute:sodium symporter small subunit